MTQSRQSSAVCPADPPQPAPSPERSIVPQITQSGRDSSLGRAGAPLGSPPGVTREGCRGAPEGTLPEVSRARHLPCRHKGGIFSAPPLSRPPAAGYSQCRTELLTVISGCWGPVAFELGSKFNKMLPCNVKSGNIKRCKIRRHVARLLLSGEKLRR